MRIRWPIVFVMTSLPEVAEAHLLGHGDAGGFAAGFAHPFSGLDHLLAMIAIGLWASQQQGRARLSLPAGFVVGSALGLTAAGAALGPTSLAASVVALGVCVALGLRSSAGVALGVSMGCGLLHGHAHAMDLASAISPDPYACGLLAATGLLHAFGASIRAVAPSSLRAVSIRAGGAAIGVAGLGLLARAIG